MKNLYKYKLYTTSLIPFIFILSILVARYYGGHLLFHSLAEIFSILVGLMMIVIVSYTYQFTKNNFLLYLGIGYFWIALLDVLHMLTFPGMSIYIGESSNTTLTFWITARFLEAFVLFSAIFVNFHTISKSKVFILFALLTALVYYLAFSKYVPILYEQGSGLTSLKINLEYTIIFILMLTLFLYTKKKKNFDESIYYYITASIVLTIFTEFTLTFYAKVDDSFTMLAHLFKFLSYWMIFLSIIKTSLENPFKFLAHESSTYNSIPFPSILVDAQGLVRQINDSTPSFLNLEKNKIINQNNHMLFHNQNTKENECEVCQAIKNGKTLLSYPLEKETSTYSFTVNPIHMEDTTLGSVQVCIDISEQKRILILLQQKKNELETIIKEAPNPIILHQDGGKIIMLNQAWVDSSGFSLDETPTIDDWVERIYDDTEITISVKKHIYSLYEITEKVDEGEFTFLNKNRDLVTWQFSSAPLGIIDGKRTVVSSAMDITELKHKDKMLINQSRHAAMGEMIGMIAHQWRQPISVISMDANNMLLDIGLENFNTAQAEKYANSITEQTQHLSQTIDDFRNFFKPDKVISEVNIREILDSTLSIVKDSLRNNNIELKISCQTEKEVDAYPRELMQVFVNIITNSKDALVVKNRDNSIINIDVFEDEKYVNTEICDNGGGIDANILSKVFDPYFSTKDEKTGTGLGLYMSKMIIEKHLNGIIEAYNIDEGACFTIRLLKN